MGFSTGRDLHIDQNLTQLALGYRPAGMIVDMISPIVNVSKETDLFPVFSRAEALSLESTARSRGAEARKITRSVSSLGYIVKNYALGSDIYLEDRVNIDPAYEAELYGGATQYLVDKLMLDWEYRVLGQVGSASNVSTGFLPSSAWNAKSNPGDPVDQILQTIEQVQATTGVRPNSILMGWRAWNFMRRNPNVRNLVNGTNNGGGFITRQQVQNVLEVDKLLVTQAFFNTSNEAQAEALSQPFHDKVLVYYAPPNPSREVPSFMYSFRWSAGGLPNMTVERHPFDSKRKTETVEVGYYQDEKITGSDYGALILGVGSAQSGGI
jgi:hypothetical protein